MNSNYWDTWKLNDWTLWVYLHLEDEDMNLWKSGTVTSEVFKYVKKILCLKENGEFS